MIPPKTVRKIIRKPRIRLSRYGVHGEAYERQLNYIKAEIPMKSDAKLNDKLQAIRMFSILHPEASSRMICTALGVNPVTFHHYKNRPLEGRSAYADRREAVLCVIQSIHPDKSQFVNQAHLRSELDERGYHISVNTLRDVLEKAGYKTHSVNQNR